MDNNLIYNDIKTRTGGEIYIGVVGPVRVGKSTFITEFMKKLVLPNVSGTYAKERAIDELPQSADGKTIMTTQPKFVPDEAVNITVAGNIDMKVRLIDCVGYLVSGVMGHEENNEPRQVKTPWSDESMPFEKAAEFGTEKVIKEHSTVGIVVTTDGSVAGISRENYVSAEERVIKEMRECNKPFVIVLNCKNPHSSESKKLANSLSEKYNASVLPISALELKDEDIDNIFEKMLLEFPVTSIKVKMPKWLQILDYDNEIIQEISREVRSFAGQITKLGDVKNSQTAFLASDSFDPVSFSNIDMGNGVVRFDVVPKESLFYQVLSKSCGFEIRDDFELVSYIKDLAIAKVEYDKIKDALDGVRDTGYGIVAPRKEDFVLNEPEIVKQGSRFGVKIKATAPSLHIMRVDVNTEVTPLVGTEVQSQELVKDLMERIDENPDGIWETNILGKSLSGLIGDNINSKLITMPVDAQNKMKKTLGRIVNEGKGGVICILL